MALPDLKSKPAFRAKFGVKDGWVLPFEIIRIINHPDYGDKSAEKICTEMKIKSQNERKKLDAAKKIIYKGGFYEGTTIAGEYAGHRVQVAKSLIRNKFLEMGQAVVYSEPEKKVMSYDDVEMEWNDELQAFTYPCPCGDLFQITKEDLKLGEEIARCPSCSLYITVIYNMEDFSRDGDQNSKKIEPQTIAVA